MIKRRSVFAGLVLLAGFTLATAACTNQPAPSSTPSGKSPAEILSAAAAKTKGQSFKYTLTYGAALTGDGADDASAGKAVVNAAYTDATSGISLKIGGTIINGRVLVKMDFGALAAIPGLGGLGDKWMRIDTAQAPRLSSFGLKPGENLMAVDSFTKGIVSAEKISETEFRGTLDLTKASIPATSAQDLARLSDKDRIAAFTAKLDGDGRIVKLVITMPTVGAFPAADLAIAYADYGATVVVAEPAAADIIDAPALIYTFLQV